MSRWPELTVERDYETFALLHLAAQMLGKIRVAHAPWVNHGWHVALQPNARGLGTLPTAASDHRTFSLTLDLCRHAIVLWVSDRGREELPLNAGSIVHSLEVTFGFELFDPAVYYISRIPSELRGTDVALVSATAFALTLLSTIYPARRAAATEPAEALRYE